MLDQIVFRTYTLKQVRSLLAKVPEFEIVGTFDFAYDIHAPHELAPDTEDVIFILRKIGEAPAGDGPVDLAFADAKGSVP
jgi:hypothetical protein